MLSQPRSYQKLGERSERDPAPVSSSEGAWPCRQLELGLLASSTGRLSFSMCKPFSVWHFVIAAPGNSRTPLFSLTGVVCFAIFIPPLFPFHSLSLGKLIHATASVTITILTSPRSPKSQDRLPHRHRWPFRSWPASHTGFYHSSTPTSPSSSVELFIVIAW